MTDELLRRQVGCVFRRDLSRKLVESDGLNFRNVALLVDHFEEVLANFFEDAFEIVGW